MLLLAVKWFGIGALAGVIGALVMVRIEEREFIKTGITPAEWDNLFGNEE